MQLTLVRPAHMLVTTLALLAIPAAPLVLSACASSNQSADGQSEYEKNPINHSVSEADIAAAKSTKPVDSDTVTLWVNGLGCPLCASNIDHQLKRVAGVQSVYVDLSVGKVTLGLKPGAPHPSPAKLGDAVEDAGFTLVKIESAPLPAAPASPSPAMPQPAPSIPSGK